ncbi:SpoIIE family protein phosphatase [Streptomyces ureilyticus]|uniref:SpoIIE family protein phosphatase n=1 Tax=Streptomyces ureilyticus TaxID=1775131 RepID=A0ABX0E276_9ACTN|nr:SpoIIE family protein phosphatase [Streptomyces ureilyticus]NGO46985.1 SpoIIE family protein phosphatase [Streptomyces ureilyticus]
MVTSEDSGVTDRRFDVADAAPLLLDAAAVVTGWSGDAQRLYGYPAPEVLGRGAADFLMPEDAARLPHLIERCERDGGWAGPLSVRHRDGHPVASMVRVIPTLAPDGPARWMVLASDMTGAAGWDMSRTVLERLATRSPIGIAIVDTDLRYVWSNTAMQQFGSGPAHERLGKRLGDIQPGLDAEALEAVMRQVLHTGVPIVDHEHVGRVRSAPHRESAHAMSFTRLEDDHGNPIGVYYTVVDVTERYRARRRLTLLDQAGERLGRTLDVRRTAQELADVAVPGLADFVAVDLLESVLEGGEPLAGPLDAMDGVPLRRAAHQSVNEGVPEAVVEIGQVARYRPGAPPIRCLTSGRSWHRERLDPLAKEWATDIPGGRAASFLDLGLHSVMIVPIRARGTTLGITTFFRGQRQDPFETDDLSLAEEFVARAALCLDNARRYTRERDAALVLQRNLLPHRLPEQDAMEVAASYRPADELTGLGGDWYDVIPLSGARVALVVGEVAGGGIEAAAAMGRLRTAVQTLADLDLRPEEVLAHLDDVVVQAAHQDDTEVDPRGGGVHAVGASCTYAVYDPVAGQCAIAAAGQSAPAIVAPDGTVDFLDLLNGPLLGVGGTPFEAVELPLAEDSLLALHTNGLLADIGLDPDEEAAAGRERLRRALERPEPLLDDRCKAVIDALVAARPPDDVALLMARARRLDPKRLVSWDLPADPAIVADVRRRTVRWLTEWELDELAFTTELVVSELVTNAIRHASGPIRLRLILTRAALICEVWDGSATAPHLRHPKTTDEGGRGLFLISQFTQRWGSRHTRDGKIIWTEQSLTGPAV